MGSLVPNVYISKVTLEEGQTDTMTSPLDTDPHIVGPAGDFSQPQLGMNVEEPKHMSVTVDLLFKEKIEPDDVSLFTIEKITNSMKAVVYFSLDQEVTDSIINLSGENVWIPQETGRVLGRDLIESGVNNFKLQEPYKTFLMEGRLQRHEISLKDISQFNGIFSTYGSSNKEVSDEFLANLDKEILPDATVVYKIPFKLNTTIANIFGGTMIDHLTVFAVTYVSFGDLIGNNPATFVGSKEDQFKTLGYNESQLGPSGVGAATDLVEIFEDHGTGITAKNEVIRNGKVNNTNTKFVYRGTPEASFGNKKGLTYYGDVHYHGPNNPAPSGYQGYMGGKASHMNSASSILQDVFGFNMGTGPGPLPELLQVVAEMPGEICDLRVKTFLDQQFFNYSDFGFDNNFKELVTPDTGPNSFAGTPFTLQEKQTQYNEWLKKKQTPYITEARYSFREDGSSNFIFSIDMGKTIRYNTAFPGLLKAIENNNKPQYEQLVNGATIQEIKIYRHEVEVEGDDKGNHQIIEDKHMPIMIAYADNINGMLPLTTLKSHGWDNPALLNVISAGDMGSIAEVDLIVSLFKDSPIRTFAVADNNIGSEQNERKNFQYSIEMAITDPMVTYLNSKLSTITNAVIELDKYYQFASQDPEYLNTYSNTFTKQFLEAYVDADNGLLGVNAQAGNTSVNAVNNCYLSSSARLSMISFLYQVLFQLKTFSQDQKTDIDNYMDSLIHPLYGNLNGIEVVLESLKKYEKSLLDLINSVSSTKGFKATTYAEETQSAKIESKGGKEAKNLIYINKLFNGSVGANIDGQNGYGYVFGRNGDFNWKPGVGGGNGYLGSTFPLSVISAERFEGRLGLEAARYDLTLIGGYPELDIDSAVVQNYRNAYLAPLYAKIQNKKNEISKENDVLTLLKILEVNQGNGDILPDLAIEFEEVGKDKVLVADQGLVPEDNTDIDVVETGLALRNKFANFVKILGDVDVSVEPGGKNKINRYHSKSKELGFTNSDGAGIPLSQMKLNENVEASTLREYLRNDFSQDPSAFLLMLSGLSKLGYFPNFSADQLMLSAFFLFQDKQSANKIPNHIKEIFSVLTQHVNNDDLDNYRKKAESLSNLVHLSLNQGNLAKLEVFTLFAAGDIMQPIFVPLTNNAYGSIKDSASPGQKMLIKLSQYDEIETFKLNKNLQLPVFDTYFMVEF